MKKNYTYSDELYHYGIKGMKWHKRKAGKKELEPRNGKGSREEKINGYSTEEEVRNWDRSLNDPYYNMTRTHRNGTTMDTVRARTGINGTVSINRTPINIDGTSSTNRYRTNITTTSSRGANTDWTRYTRKKAKTKKSKASNYRHLG